MALFFDLPRQNASVSETDWCADRSILALLSAYEEYLVTFKLMTSQVVQRAGPLRTFIYVLGSQGVNGEDVIASSEAARGLVRSRVEFPPAPIRGVF